MLRIQTRQSTGTTIFALEGRFTRESAEHLRALVALSNNGTATLIFDLTELLYVDAAGEEALSFFRRLGAQFIADTAYALNVCERLDLPLAPAIPTTSERTTLQKVPNRR